MFYSCCGWQPSLLARDLSSGTPWGSANIMMNQALADIQARQTLYMTPVMCFNNFTPYGVPSSGMDFLLNPACAITPLNAGSSWSIYA